MSRPTEQTAVIASSFSSDEAPHSTASIMPCVLGDRDEGARQTADDDDAIAPPFLTASVRSASAAVVPGAPALLEAHRLEDLGHRVADGRRRRQRQVDDAEAHAVAEARARPRGR